MLVPLTMQPVANRRRCRFRFEDIDLGDMHAGDAFGAEDSRHSGHFVLRQLTNLKPVLVAELPVEDLGVLDPLLSYCDAAEDYDAAVATDVHPAAQPH